MSKEDMDLRAQLEQIINWTSYRAKDTPTSVDNAVNRLLHIIANQRKEAATEAELETVDNIIAGIQSSKVSNTIALALIADLDNYKRQLSRSQSTQRSES